MVAFRDDRQLTGSGDRLVIAPGVSRTPAIAVVGAELASTSSSRPSSRRSLCHGLRDADSFFSGAAAARSAVAGHEAAGLPLMQRGRERLVSSAAAGSRSTGLNNTTTLCHDGPVSGRCVPRARLTAPRAGHHHHRIRPNGGRVAHFESVHVQARRSRMRRFVRCPSKAQDAAPLCLPASHERRAGGRASGTSSDLRQPCAVGPLPTW